MAHDDAILLNSLPGSSINRSALNGCSRCTISFHAVSVLSSIESRGSQRRTRTYGFFLRNDPSFSLSGQDIRNCLKPLAWISYILLSPSLPFNTTSLTRYLMHDKVSMRLLQCSRGRLVCDSSRDCASSGVIIPRILDIECSIWTSSRLCSGWGIIWYEVRLEGKQLWYDEAGPTQSKMEASLDCDTTSVSRRPRDLSDFPYNTGKWRLKIPKRE